MSDDLRRGAGDFLKDRRRIAALTSVVALAMGVVSLYQFGLVTRVPEPRLPLLDADLADASGEAYRLLHTPDAALGLRSAAGTLVLVGMGARDRATTMPWVPIAVAAKAAGDVVGAVVLTAEQLTRHRALRAWCSLAALAQLATLPAALPAALPEAREAGAACAPGPEPRPRW